MLAPKSIEVEVADPISLRGRQHPESRHGKRPVGTSGARTASMQSKGLMGTREIHHVQEVLVGSDEPATRGRSDDVVEVRLADSTPRPGEPATRGSGQRKLNRSRET